MAQVKIVTDAERETINRDEGDRYWPVIGADGKLHCSCSRPLVKITDKIYRCSAGYPQFNMDEGEILVDKFGRMMIKAKSHADGKARSKEDKKAESAQVKRNGSDDEDGDEDDEEEEDE